MKKSRGFTPLETSCRGQLARRRRASLTGFTLVELIVSVGLFALIMTLVTGAYLIMIGINRQVQASATGINNLSFALEDMTRSIRTGTAYSGAEGSTFSFTNANGQPVTYSIASSAIQKTVTNVITGSIVTSSLTDPSVTITSLAFYPVGTGNTSSGDYQQSRVTMIVSGTVSSGPGKIESFTIQTGATMRVSDI